MGAPWLERYGKAGGTEVWWIPSDEFCTMPNQSMRYLIDFSMNLTHLEVSVSSWSLFSSCWEAPRMRDTSGNSSINLLLWLKARHWALRCTLRVVTCSSALGCCFIHLPFFNAHITTFHLLCKIRSLLTGIIQVRCGMSLCPGVDKIVVQIKKFLLFNTGPLI